MHYRGYSGRGKPLKTGSVSDIDIIKAEANGVLFDLGLVFHHESCVFCVHDWNDDSDLNGDSIHLF
jgi:hypothetical protein